ncbi:MAG: S-adenosylmethionine decarboxylase family protein [Planctomycetales bacterium]
MSMGAEWLIDAMDCDGTRLGDLPGMRAVCDQVVAELRLRVVAAPLWHQFPEPGGVTGLYLLSESHLACHTFPELGLATFNLYCCRPREAWPWERKLRELLGAKRVVVRCVERGVGAAPGSEVGARSPVLGGAVQ